MPEEPQTNQGNQPPAPEELKPVSASANPAESAQQDSPYKKGDKPPKQKRRGSYRPSHKATFLALIVVIGILLINGGVIFFVLKKQSSLEQQVSNSPVTIDQAALEKLGVSQTPVKATGLELTVNPDAQFNGKVKIAGDTTIGGQLTLNNNFSANSASFANLQAGKTALSELNVNGNSTISSLNLRNDLTIAGATNMQGQVTIARLLTAANINITGNLSVGGTLAIRNFRTGSLTLDTTLTVGGHIITRGEVPGISRGSALGSNGTATISGNDASGTIFAGVGVGAVAGEVACITFRTAYSSTPNITISQSAPLNAYISRNAGGFCVFTGSAMSPGGYQFSYIVEQ